MICLDDLWDLPSPYVLHATVQPEDIDGLQHTNNTVYVKWCEAVAWSHSVSLGLDLAAYRRLDRAMAIKRSEYDYLLASHEGDNVAIGTWIVSWDGRLTMQRRFQVIRVEDGATLLRAQINFVCIELSTGKARRLPPEFIEGYGPVVQSMAEGDLAD